MATPMGPLGPILRYRSHETGVACLVAEVPTARVDVQPPAGFRWGDIFIFHYPDGGGGGVDFMTRERLLADPSKVSGLLSGPSPLPTNMWMLRELRHMDGSPTHIVPCQGNRTVRRWRRWWQRHW